MRLLLGWKPCLFFFLSKDELQQKHQVKRSLGYLGGSVWMDILHPKTLSVLQPACLEHGYCVSRIMLTMVDLKGQTERQLANLGFGF